MTRLTDKTASAQVIEDATEPWREGQLEQVEAWIATSEAWLLAKDTDKAMVALQRAATLKPDHTMVGLLATDLMASSPLQKNCATATGIARSSPAGATVLRTPLGRLATPARICQPVGSADPKPPHTAQPG